MENFISHQETEFPFPVGVLVIVGENGVAITNISQQHGGKVKVGTAIWRATSDSYIQEGEIIRVIGTGVKNLVLEVQANKP